MLKITKAEGDVVEIEAEGRLVHDEYMRVVPQFEEIIGRRGSLRCLIDMQGLTGITPRAAVDDLSFDFKHAREIKRCAVVTDRRWHEWMARAWGAIMPDTDVRCFRPEDRAAAATWIRA